MDNLKRVDIKLSIETLAWAASEATKLGMSRRQFLSSCVEELKCIKGKQSFDAPLYQREYPLSVTECTTTKPELDGYAVKKTHIGVMDAQQLRDKGVDVENLLEKGLLKKLE